MKGNKEIVSAGTFEEGKDGSRGDHTRVKQRLRARRYMKFQAVTHHNEKKVPRE